MSASASGVQSNSVSVDSCVQRHRRTGDNLDIAWQFNHWKDLNDKKKIYCDFCDKVSNGGISRARRHQLGISGDVAPCRKTPPDVKALLQADFDEKQRKAQGIEEFQAQLDDDVHDHIEDIRRIRTGKRPSDSSLSAPNAKKGPLDVMFMVKNTRQTNVNDAADKEARAGTIQYIARFFYTNGIAFNVARSKHFKLMLEAVGTYGRHLKPPSYYEMRGPLLDIELEETKKMLEPHLKARVKYGCSTMSDGWTDRKNRTLINFLVNSTAGTMFVKSIDASEHSKTGDMLYELPSSFVDEMGVQNVVQLITDNGSNYVYAGRKLMQNKPHIFWTPCAAHSIDIMLEDIGKIPKIKKAIQKGCALVDYISNHTFSLSLMRKKTNNVELVKHGVTRFATTFLTLQRLHNIKSKLREMFLCEEWLNSKCNKEAKGKQAATCALMPSFWNDVLRTLKSMAPLVDVLRMVDNEKKPVMGEIYAAMDKCT